MRSYGYGSRSHQDAPRKSSRYVENIKMKPIMEAIDRMYVAKTSGSEREFNEALNTVFLEALNQRML